MMRGRVTEREFLEPLKMVRSYIVGRRCTCPSSYTVVRRITQVENGIDTKTADTRCPTQFNETNSSNCVSQLMS